MKGLSLAIDTTSAAGSRCVNLMREAAEWRLLGWLFVPPRGDWKIQVARLADEVRDRLLREAAQAAEQQASEGLYATTFGPGGPAAPREVSHRQAALSGQFLAELLGYYNAFGYRTPYDEPADHVAVETDFIAYLRLKQAYAVARDDKEQADVTEAAARQFLADHLSAIAEPLGRMLEASGVRYLALAGAALARRAGPSFYTAEHATDAWRALVGSPLPIYDPDDGCGGFTVNW